MNTYQITEKEIKGLKLLAGGELNMIKIIYFENIKEAETYVKNNNIKNYYYTTPEFLENGVDLNIRGEMKE